MPCYALRRAFGLVSSCCVHLQALQIVAETARRQAMVLGVSDTLSDLGWILFASGVLAILMAKLGNGRPEQPSGTTR
jgi:hypothetical protein